MLLFFGEVCSVKLRFKIYRETSVLCYGILYLAFVCTFFFGGGGSLPNAYKDFMSPKLMLCQN
jgi:hypothetical protein